MLLRVGVGKGNRPDQSSQPTQAAPDAIGEGKVPGNWAATLVMDFRVFARCARENLFQHAIVQFLLAPVGGGLHERQDDRVGILLGRR